MCQRQGGCGCSWDCWDLVGGAKTGSGADGDKMGEGSERLMDRWHRAPSLFAESGKRHKVFFQRRKELNGGWWIVFTERGREDQ